MLLPPQKLSSFFPPASPASFAGENHHSGVPDFDRVSDAVALAPAGTGCTEGDRNRGHGCGSKAGAVCQMPSRSGSIRDQCFPHTKFSPFRCLLLLLLLPVVVVVVAAVIVVVVVLPPGLIPTWLLPCSRALSSGTCARARTTPAWAST